MNTVNNFELLSKALFPNGVCDDGEFYFVQVLVRGKDGNNVNGNNKNCLVRYYVIRSTEKLMEIESEVKELCHLHNARAYIHPTPRNDKEVAAVMLNDAVKEFTDGNYHMFRRLYSTACGKSFIANKKLFIVDIDRLHDETESNFVTKIKTIIETVETCRGKIRPDANGIFRKVIITVPTKSGVHLITAPFDVGQFETAMHTKGVSMPDIHKNNPTLLFCYKS